MRKIAAALVAAALLFSLTACYEQTAEEKARDAESAKVKESRPKGDSTEQRNLKERQSRDEQADRIGYVYLSSFGQPVGYYVIKGKVSNGGSQLGPENEIVWSRRGNSSDTGVVVVDGPQDDNTYGQGDPGIFFFTADGTKVETTYDYMWSDKPLALPEFTKIK